MPTTKPSDLSTRIWGSTAPPGNVVDPGSTKFNAGWVVEIPDMEYFNHYQNLISSALAHINENGIPQWDAATDYNARAIVLASDGHIYFTVAGGGGADPALSQGTWVRLFRFQGSNGIQAAIDANNQVTITGTDATILAKGVVQLSNSISSNSQTIAATSKAVSDLGATIPAYTAAIANHTRIGHMHIRTGDIAGDSVDIHPLLASTGGAGIPSLTITSTEMPALAALPASAKAIILSLDIFITPSATNVNGTVYLAKTDDFDDISRNVAWANTYDDGETPPNRVVVPQIIVPLDINQEFEAGRSSVSLQFFDNVFVRYQGFLTE